MRTADDDLCILQHAVIDLRIAADHGNDGIGIIAADSVHHLAAFGSGRIGHGTGEDQSGIRLFLKRNTLPAFMLKQRGNAFRFIGIDLAAEVTD